MKARTLSLLAAALVTQQAVAVSLSADGRGQVLLFPYYTANGGNDSIVTLMNTTAAGKALKLRFREGRNGRTVLDLNLYLASHDAWAGAVTRNDAGAPILRVFDPSCTVPTLNASATVAGAKEIAFSNAAYANYDRAGSGPDRAREGYVEVLEMGEIDPAFTLPTSGGSIRFDGAVIPADASGRPYDCAAVVAAWSVGGTFLASNGVELSVPKGGLIGSGTLMNVGQGTDYSFEPTALAAVFGAKRHTAPGDAHPDFDDAIPSSLVVMEDTAIHSTWSRGTDAVSAVLMHSAVINEYFTSPELNAATDLVLTFPTKPLYVARESDTATATRAPFTAKFDDLQPPGPAASGPLLADGSSTGACESVVIDGYGRGGEWQTAPFLTAGAEPETLCWTANVLTFGDVLSSANAVPVGWFAMSSDGSIKLNFSDTNQKLTSTEDHQYRGLPVAGFSAVRFVNGNMGGVLSNYGGAFAHKYEMLIE